MLTRENINPDTLNNITFGSDWTLFLDRDGVINRKRDHDYVKSWEEFVFTEGAPEALATCSAIFKRIVVVTNQRGVGRGLMTEEQLKDIHDKMLLEISQAGGRIDKVYYCLATSPDDPYRKPNTGMGLQAATDYSDIDFKKSVIVGDSLSDMEFGRKLGMLCFLISNKYQSADTHLFDAQFNSLLACSAYIRRLSRLNVS